jgi:hypothetical protein
MTNVTTAPKTKTTERRKRIPSTTEPSSSDGVSVNVWKGDDLDRDIVVTGNRDVRDPKMASVVKEYLEATENDLATQRRCEQEIDLAVERANKANDDLQAMLKGLGGFSVIFQGLCFQPDDQPNCFPAIPVINLVD